jgi:transcriptional regulator with XRE-family HTH domain
VAIGNEIQSLRLKAGLNQTQLAKLAGVQQGHLSQIENGHRKPTLATLRKLRTALDLDPEAFHALLEKAA